MHSIPFDVANNCYVNLFVEEKKYAKLFFKWNLKNNQTKGGPVKGALFATNAYQAMPKKSLQNGKGP